MKAIKLRSEDQRKEKLKEPASSESLKLCVVVIHPCKLLEHHLTGDLKTIAVCAHGFLGKEHMEI